MAGFAPSPFGRFSDVHRGPVVQVITAGRKGQRAIEDAGHGLFTRYLLEALSGQADQDGRGVSAAQLAVWIESRVRQVSEGRMTPQYARVDGEGQFMLTFPGATARASATDLSGSFTGMIEAKIADRARSFPATVTFVQKGSDLSGTWTTSFSSGQMTGIIDGLSVRAFRVNQTLPCPRIFHGTATADSSHNLLTGAYNGIECDGTLFASTFRLNRIEAVRLEDSRLALPDYLNIGVSYLYQERPDDALGYSTRHDNSRKPAATTRIASKRSCSLPLPKTT